MDNNYFRNKKCFICKKPAEIYRSVKSKNYFLCNECDKLNKPFCEIEHGSSFSLQK